MNWNGYSISVTAAAAASACAVRFQPCSIWFGVKKEFHATAMKIGKPVFKAMAGGSTDVAPDYISSDCQLAGHHILQGMREAGLKQTKMAHPLTLLRIAYGI